MASTQSLNAATQDRKSRLAQLKSLKRKQAEVEQEGDENLSRHSKSPSNTKDDVHVSRKYLSGRNYDVETRGAKLGFESAPSNGQETLETKAKALEAETTREAAEEAKADKALDLFKLQPKKPNWDLKRDLDRKLEILNIRTDNAIARLVRERIASQKASRIGAERGGGDEVSSTNRDSHSDDAYGIDGPALVEATNVREREDLDEARREREYEEEQDEERG